MPWIRDRLGWMINLEHVRQLRSQFATDAQGRYPVWAVLQDGELLQLCSTQSFEESKAVLARITEGLKQAGESVISLSEDDTDRS